MGVVLYDHIRIIEHSPLSTGLHKCRQEFVFVVWESVSHGQIHTGVFSGHEKGKDNIQEDTLERCYRQRGISVAVCIQIRNTPLVLIRIKERVSYRVCI